MKSDIREGLECDNKAVLLGYTTEVFIEYKGMSFNVLVKPDTDLDDRFKCWCMDGQEWVYINGWLADSINEC